MSLALQVGVVGSQAAPQSLVTTTYSRPRAKRLHFQHEPLLNRLVPATAAVGATLAACARDRRSSVGLRSFSSSASESGRAQLSTGEAVSARREAVLGSAAALCAAQLPSGAAAAAASAPAVVKSLWASGKEPRGAEAERWVQYFAEDCIYEDLYYGEPVVGRQALLSLLQEKALPKGSKLVVDRISDGKMACGFTWHIAQDGVGVGLRGLSFVRIGADGLVKYVREVAEPVFKAGVLTEKLLETITKDQEVAPKSPSSLMKLTEATRPKDAKGVVEMLYGPVQQSGGDALQFFAEDVCYEDMNYETPFIGKPAVGEFLGRFQTLQGVTFNLEEISDGKQAVGFTYTIYVAGQPRGIKGATFYEVDKSGLVNYVRDVPESVAKPPPLQRIARTIQPGLRRFGPAPPLPGDIAGADPLLQV